MTIIKIVTGRRVVISKAVGRLMNGESQFWRWGDGTLRLTFGRFGGRWCIVISRRVGVVNDFHCCAIL